MTDPFARLKARNDLFINELFGEDSTEQQQQQQQQQQKKKRKLKPSHSTKTTTPTLTESSDRLARLASHGNAFMSLINDEAPAVLNRRQKQMLKKRAVAQSGVNEASRSDEEEEKDVEEEEEEEEEEQRIPSEEPPNNKKRKAVVVVVHADGLAATNEATNETKGYGMNSVNARKAFLSSKITKMADSAVKSAKTAAGRQEDDDDRRNDAELMSILETTKLIENYSAEQLDGKERRSWMAEQSLKLGMKKEPKKGNAPMAMGIGMKRKQMRVDAKELEEAKNTGLYHRTLKHTYAGSASNKSKPRKSEDRGLRTGIGKFKNGTLHISEADIRRVERSGGSGGKGKKIGAKKKGKGVKKLVR